MNILSLIGNTPIILLEKISKEVGANIYVKAEMFNPAGSIKDRVSFAYIDNALKRRDIGVGDEVVEASSGNLGIGLALVCQQFGLNLTICMSEAASVERRKIMNAFGAKIELSPAEKGMLGALDLANKIIDKKRADGKSVFSPNQFSNPDGPKVHYETSAPEIGEFIKTHNIELAAFVAGIGSGASFSGIGKYLREQNKNIYLCPIEPEESAVFSGKAPAPHGIQGIGAGFIPEVMDNSLISEVLKVHTNNAIEMTKKLAKVDGLNAGISTGANVLGAINLAKRPEFQGKNILTIACDTGERYMSTSLFTT